MAFKTSATWKQIDSKVALASCFSVVPLVKPKIAPLASLSQYGVPKPTNAGTK
jgi:hypothetical protein